MTMKLLSSAILSACAMFITPPAAAAWHTNPHAFSKWARVMDAETITPKNHAPLITLLHAELQKYSTYTRAPDYLVYPREADHWATRKELEEYQVGDCEDFAIAEYFDLLEHGLRDEDLYIVVGQIPKTKDVHAVLLVKNRYYLDSRSDNLHDVAELPRIMHIIYRINRKQWKVG